MIHFATQDNGWLELDFVKCDEHPAKIGEHRQTYYYNRSVSNADIERQMRSYDVASVGNDKLVSVTFNHSGRKVTVSPFHRLGLHDESLLEATYIAHVMSESAKSNGLKGNSYAAICRNIMKECGVESSQLQPRWRWLAHRCIHQGPMVCVTGGSDNATQLDRNSAFLTCLYAPVPVHGTFQPGSRKWTRIRRLDGFVSANVTVPDTVYLGRIPPLPTKIRGRVIYPVGTFNGQWTIPMLRVAEEECGVIVNSIHESVTCKVDTLHARAADRIAEIDYKRLRKAVYLRYWGRMAYAGGMVGSTAKPNIPRNEIVRFPWSTLFWREERDGYGNMSSDYMPDHSAYIASANSIAMMRMLNRYKPFEVIASHVDAIWVNGSHAADSGWSVKSNGKLRFFGIGTYVHGSKVGAMGFSGEPTPENVTLHGQTVDDKHRDWHFQIKPSESQYATSDPILLTDSEIPGHDDVYHSKWTPKGWIF